MRVAWFMEVNNLKRIRVSAHSYIKLGRFSGNFKRDAAREGHNGASAWRWAKIL